MTAVAPREASNFWAETVAPVARPELTGPVSVDVAVVGGGYTGLWTALALTDRDPSLRVVVLERDTVGYGASGRNGGFCDPSLTHGLANGLRHFPHEIAELQRLGQDNLAAMAAFFDSAGIHCDYEPTGMLDVAVAGHQVDELRELAELHASHGEVAELLDRDEVAEHLRSPMALAGLHRPDAGGVLNPARLCAGLARAAEQRGVVVYEGTAVTGLCRAGTGVAVDTPSGTVTAGQAVLATNAYSAGVLPRTRRAYVPVHDYIVVTEPLGAERLAALGWKRRQGVADAGNQFHYLRLTADDRLLFGGFDAVYDFGGPVGPAYDARPETFARLGAHLRQLFPCLHDVRLTHAWGGAIATTTRFTPVFGDALGGRLVYALGYTGLGVAATRFAGQVLADRLTRPDSPLLRLRYTTAAPVPFPPEPLRWAGVTLVRRSLARADRRGGRRNLLLKTLDTLGIGFDS